MGLCVTQSHWNGSSGSVCHAFVAHAAQHRVIKKSERMEAKEAELSRRLFDAAKGARLPKSFVVDVIRQFASDYEDELETRLARLLGPFEALVAALDVGRMPYDFDRVSSGQGRPPLVYNFEYAGVCWSSTALVKSAVDAESGRLTKLLHINVPTDGVVILNAEEYAPAVRVSRVNSVAHQPRDGPIEWLDVEPLVRHHGLVDVYKYVRAWFPKAKRDDVLFRTLLAPDRQRLDIRGLLRNGEFDVAFVVCFEPSYPEPAHDLSQYVPLPVRRRPSDAAAAAGKRARAE